MSSTAAADAVIRSPDAPAAAAARERLDALAKPAGALGRLEELAIWVAGCQGQCPPRPLDDVRAVVLAGDHGVVNAGVSAFPSAVTVAVTQAMITGGAGMAALCRTQGVPLRVLDIAIDADVPGVPADVASHKIRRSSGSIDVQDALRDVEVDQALRTGAAIFEEERAAGLDLLIVGDLGIGNTTPTTALIASRLGLPAEQITGRGAGLTDEALAGKAAVIRQALRRVAEISDGRRRLAALGSADLAVGAGVLIAAARAGVPVLLDGVISCAEALIAEEIAPGAVAWFTAGHRSAEPAADAALRALGLEPILDLGMRLGEGTGAMTALPVLRTAVTLIRDMALLSDLLSAQ